MTIEMEDVQIRQRFDIAYTELRAEFIRISRPYLGVRELNLLKLKYSEVINSGRMFDYIKDVEGLLRILEKRGTLSYNNIEILKYISETYVRTSELESLLTNYEGQPRPLLPPHNRYLALSASVPPIEAPSGTSGVETILNNASNMHRQPIRVTLYTTQPAFRITLPGSLEIGSAKEASTNHESELMTRVFQELSENLGRHWRNVARHLRVTEHDIDEIDQQSNLSLSEKALKALQKFQSKSDPLQWKSKLRYALTESRRRDLMELVDELLSRES